MKRKLLLFLSVILIVAGLFIFLKVLSSFKTSGKGALQVTANVKSTVFLDGKQIGATQLCKCNQNDTIKTGEYEIRVEPQDTQYAAYTTRIKINSGVLTAIDRTFLPGSLASSYSLTLEEATSQKPQLLITSIPEGAMVTIDSVPTGATPLTTDSLSASEHEIEIQKQGFSKKTIRIRSVENHKLIVNAMLGTEGAQEAEDSLVTPTPEIVNVTTTPAPAVNITVTILDTPNGFLRVRDGAGTTFKEVARVNTGETFNLADEQTGWYQITLTDGTTGWISSSFAKKN